VANEDIIISSVVGLSAAKSYTFCNTSYLPKSRTMWQEVFSLLPVAKNNVFFLTCCLTVFMKIARFLQYTLQKCQLTGIFLLMFVANIKLFFVSSVVIKIPYLLQ
jgi:hypothetical protein